MTERERWVVYPLLFLALGAALRDKLVDRTTTRSIVCQELAVVDEETTGRQPGRVLAKIGRKPGSEAAAYFVINGDVEIIDDDPAGVQSPRTLVRIGRTAPSPGAPASGYVAVSGQINADGVINAKQYAYHGIPFVPAGMLPGISIPDLMRALQQSGAKGLTPDAMRLPNPPSPGKRSKVPPPSNAPESRPNATPQSQAKEQSRGDGSTGRVPEE